MSSRWRLLTFQSVPYVLGLFNHVKTWSKIIIEWQRSTWPHSVKLQAPASKFYFNVLPSKTLAKSCLSVKNVSRSVPKQWWKQTLRTSYTPTSFQIFRKNSYLRRFPRHQNTAERRAPSAICLGGDIYRLFPLKRYHLFLFRRQSVPWASTRERTRGEEENVLIPCGPVQREAATNFKRWSFWRRLWRRDVSQSFWKWWICCRSCYIGNLLSKDETSQYKKLWLGFDWRQVLVFCFRT